MPKKKTTWQKTWEKLSEQEKEAYRHFQRIMKKMQRNADRIRPYYPRPRARKSHKKKKDARVRAMHEKPREMSRCFLCKEEIPLGQGVIAEIEKGFYRKKSPHKVRAVICLDCKDKPEVIRYRVSRGHGSWIQNKNEE